MWVILSQIKKLTYTYYLSAHVSICFIIPHVKIVSQDWLTKVGHSIMSTGEISTGKTSTVLTGPTGSHCFKWYFTKLGFVWYNKTNMPCQCGYPDGMSPLWETIHQDTHTGMAYLYIIFISKVWSRLMNEWMNEWSLKGTSAHKGHLVPYSFSQKVVLLQRIWF